MTMFSKRIRSILVSVAKLYGTVVLCKLLAGLIRQIRQKRMLRTVPHIQLPLHPLLGHVPAWNARLKDLHHMRVEATRGQTICKLVLPLGDPNGYVVHVLKADGVRHMLKDAFEKYTKGDPEDVFLFHMVHEWIGNGIFTVQHGTGAPDGGQMWKFQRKTAAAIFTKDNFSNAMHQVFVRKAHRLRGMLVDGETVDMQAHFFNYTMDSIMEIFFGERTDIVGGELNVYGAAYDDAHRALMRYFLRNFVTKALWDLLPWPLGGLQGLGMRCSQKLDRDYREFRRNVEILNRESAKLIQKVLKDENVATRSDLISLYVQAGNVGGMPYDMKFLRDTALNFVIAGRDTTACAFSWMFYILATHPEIQRRVLEEIDAKLPSGTEPDIKMVHHSNMPLLQALVYETLRLYPPVPNDTKVASCDDVFPDGSRIPKGVYIEYYPYVMGRDADVYDEPTAVRLERWIPFTAPPAHEFPVFQAGPRICLGMNMALFEMKILATMLLQEFSFTLLEGEAEKIHYNYTITMSVCNSKKQDSHNLWLVPHRRTPHVKSL